MKLFKDNQNNIFAYDDNGSQDHLIGDKTAITQTEVDEITKANEVARFNALSYSEKRSAEYPPLTDYVDGIVKGDQAQIEKYIADCQAVKAKYPKAG